MLQIRECEAPRARPIIPENGPRRMQVADKTLIVYGWFRLSQYPGVSLQWSHPQTILNLATIMRRWAGCYVVKEDSK